MGCNPKAYLTSDYINAHLDAYQSLFCSFSLWIDGAADVFIVSLFRSKLDIDVDKAKESTV